MSDRRNNNNDAKKRRADDGGSVVAAAAAAVETPSSKDDKLMSALHQLLDQNSTQMAMIKNMQGDITSMKGEITQLREKCDGMEKIMLSRFDVVDNKQKYHRVLLQNQKWKYSAPRPSQQYWDSLDEDGDQDDAAEEFLEQIKEGTELMRYGNGRYYILVCPNIRVPYNQEFLPHWEEFADALEQHEYCLSAYQMMALNQFFGYVMLNYQTTCYVHYQMRSSQRIFANLLYRTTTLDREALTLC